MRTSKEMDTGRENGNGKRKADGEAIIGRAVTVQKRNGDRSIEDLACYRCGEIGHLKMYSMSQFYRDECSQCERLLQSQ